MSVVSVVIGYVVVEYNQASGLPGLATSDLFDRPKDARHVVDDLTRDARSRGRREQYRVGAVYLDDERDEETNP